MGEKRFRIIGLSGAEKRFKIIGLRGAAKELRSIFSQITLDFFDECIGKECVLTDAPGLVKVFGATPIKDTLGDDDDDRDREKEKPDTLCHISFLTLEEVYQKRYIVVETFPPELSNVLMDSDTCNAKLFYDYDDAQAYADEECQDGRVVTI